MKKLKSNRYEKAVNEIKNLDENLSSKIVEEIKESDKDHFHVATIKISDRPGQVKNDVSVVTQKLNQIQFDKLQKNFQFLGFNKLILSHDPRLNVEKEFKIVPPVKTQDEIDAEIEAEVEARVKARLEAQEGKEEKDPVKTQDENSNVYGKTSKEMKAFAETNEIDIVGLIKKEEIEGAIVAWIEAQKEA